MNRTMNRTFIPLAAAFALSFGTGCPGSDGTRRSAQQEKQPVTTSTTTAKNADDDGICVGFCTGPRISPSGKVKITPGFGIGLDL